MHTFLLHRAVAQFPLHPAFITPSSFSPWTHALFRITAFDSSCWPTLNSDELEGRWRHGRGGAGGAESESPTRWRQPGAWLVQSAALAGYTGIIHERRPALQSPSFSVLAASSALASSASLLPCGVAQPRRTSQAERSWSMTLQRAAKSLLAVPWGTAQVTARERMKRVAPPAPWHRRARSWRFSSCRSRRLRRYRCLRA